jgi:ABC-2 type transport system ATP-binding protein
MTTMLTQPNNRSGANTAHDGIVATNVSKSFDDVHALKGVSFSAPKGKALGILGSNGAGKTTLINLLTTTARPDSGEIIINGIPILDNPNPIRQQLGVVSQEDRFDTYLTLWENLCLHAELHGLHKKEFVPRIDHLLSQVDLFERRHDYIDTFSGGMKRKASLIRALIHHPSILFLDEPTTGLDPLARRQVWEAIMALKEGRTMVLTSHYMQEADELSDHIILLDKGQILMEGSPNQLKAAVAEKQAGWQFNITFAQPVAEDWLPKLKTILNEHNLADIALTQPNSDTILLKRSQRPDSMAFLQAFIGQLPAELFIGAQQALPTLETVFFSAIGETTNALVSQ